MIVVKSAIEILLKQDLI